MYEIRQLKLPEGSLYFERNTSTHIGFGRNVGGKGLLRWRQAVASLQSICEEALNPSCNKTAFEEALPGYHHREAGRGDLERRHVDSQNAMLEAWKAKKKGWKL